MGTNRVQKTKNMTSEINRVKAYKIGLDADSHMSSLEDKSVVSLEKGNK